MNDTLRIQPKGWRITIKEQNRRRDYQREESTFSIGQKKDGEETWKEVADYNGRYRISTFGRVFKLWNKGGGIMQGSPQNKSGYIRVHLTRPDGLSNIRSVHRLVADAFLLKRDGANHVNHIDFNVANNSVENLEWVTPLENVRHSSRAGRMKHPGTRRGESNPNSKLTNENVSAIKAELLLGETIRHLATRFGVTDGAVAHIKHKRQWL